MSVNKPPPGKLRKEVHLVSIILSLSLPLRLVSAHKLDDNQPDSLQSRASDSESEVKYEISMEWKIYVVKF